MDQGEQYLRLEVGQFLGLLAGPEPAPSGGGAAALAVALGAALGAMTARLSARHLGTEEAEALAAEAQRLSAAAASLIQADADAYQGVTQARRQRTGDIAAALSAASAVPVQISELGAATARAAARLAQAGNPNLRGDAITGALLAAAGARAAAALVAINLAGAPDDPRPAQATALADEATSLAASAAGSASPDAGGAGKRRPPPQARLP
jgi:methenyltetrahydrofolate cyclohydrolase